MRKLILGAATVLLAACQSVPEEPLRATAALQPTAAGGKALGEATFEDEGGKLHLTVFAQGLKPGQPYALQILESADCGAPADRRAGNLPALRAEKNGHANFDADLPGFTVAAGPSSIVGRGLAIDESGTRVACGLIKPG